MRWTWRKNSHTRLEGMGMVITTLESIRALPRPAKVTYVLLPSHSLSRDLKRNCHMRARRQASPWQQVYSNRHGIQPECPTAGKRREKLCYVHGNFKTHKTIPTLFTDAYVFNEQKNGHGCDDYQIWDSDILWGEQWNGGRISGISNASVFFFNCANCMFSFLRGL